MPDLYKTSDGQIHDSRSVAEAHQGWLNSGVSAETSRILDQQAQDRIDARSNEERNINQLMKEGKFDDIIAKYTPIVEQKIREGDYHNSYMFACKALCVRGRAYLAKGDRENATADFKSAAKYGRTGNTDYYEGDVELEKMNKSSTLSLPYTKDEYNEYTKLIKTIRAPGGTTQYMRLRAQVELNKGTFKPENYEQYFRKSGGKKVITLLIIVAVAAGVIYKVLEFLGIISF